MNDQLQAFARKTILEGLNKLPSANQMFKVQVHELKVEVGRVEPRGMQE